MVASSLEYPKEAFSVNIKTIVNAWNVANYCYNPDKLYSSYRAFYVGINIIVIYNAIGLIFVQIATVNASFEQLVLYHLQYLPSEETIFESGYKLLVLDKYARHNSPYIIMHWFIK